MLHHWLQGKGIEQVLGGWAHRQQAAGQGRKVKDGLNTKATEGNCWAIGGTSDNAKAKETN
jgi:hypothetical protein